MAYSTSKNTSAQAQMLANRLQKRFNHLKKWAYRRNVEAFRLYDRDIPEVPLVLDFYGDIRQTETAAVSGALYKRPYEKDPQEELMWLAEMKNAVSESLILAPENIILKQRERQRGNAQYERNGVRQFTAVTDFPRAEILENFQITKIVREGDLAFKVNLSDYIDSGLFLDRRLLRSLAGSHAAGKKILNLFSYTGSFSVYAAFNGAVSTDSVDLSNTYLAWAAENFALNNFSVALQGQRDFFQKPQRGGKSAARHNEQHNGSHGGGAQRSGDGFSKNPSSHKLIRADVSEFIFQAMENSFKWDIIILDPPAFSNSKKTGRTFDLRRDFTGLAGNCAKLLLPGGKLFISVSARGWRPKADDLESLGLSVTDITKEVTDEDFKGRKTPTSFMLCNN
jgi:23S rRNA G2069 N7-methylase RlmK/C1962 C5-methylase RlmI